jgi:hypothetical protein
MAAGPEKASGPTPAAAVEGHCAAWGTMDRAERDRVLARVFAADGVYNDPTAYVAGRAALSDHIAKFQLANPGSRFRCSAPQTHHGAMRVSWALVKADGTVDTAGMDFYELGPDGLIRRVTGFFGPPPTLGPER